MCLGARFTHLHHCFVLLFTTMQTPHLFIPPAPLSSANKSPSPPLDFILPSPPSSHLYNTVKYLPFCICLTSLLCSLCICLLCCEPCCSKTGRHAGEGLTSLIAPITSFFPPSSFSLSSLPPVRMHVRQAFRWKGTAGLEKFQQTLKKLQR